MVYGHSGATKTVSVRGGDKGARSIRRCGADRRNRGHTDLVVRRAYRVGACLIGLALCVAGCSSGGGKHAAPTTVEPNERTTGTPTASQPRTGTLAGTLRTVGGPVTAPKGALSGPIRIVSASGRHWRAQASATRGFAVELPTGRYQVTGGGVNGSTDECVGPARALVRKDQTTRVLVVCDRD